MTDTKNDSWLANMDNCYILFNPERNIIMSEMIGFCNSKIDPVIILSCFVMNTCTYLDGFDINQKFIEQAIKYFTSENWYDKDLIDKIRALVFCGKDMTKQAVFLHIWTVIIQKFLPEDTPQETESETTSIETGIANISLETEVVDTNEAIHIVD